MALTIDIRPSTQQIAFNLKRWNEILADRELTKLPHRVETDRHGRILLSPPATPNHGRKQFWLADRMKEELPEGIVITECPISTSDGVAAIDVAWLDHDRAEEAGSALPLVNAPDICVEIVSPSDTAGAINEKRELYFGAGAAEVWICELKDNIRLYSKDSAEPQEHSRLCPDFPTLLR
jgi:Uma2 family endonuclease